MRDIAAALTISVGNLTYHFKKKEELVTGAGPAKKLYSKDCPANAV